MNLIISIGKNLRSLHRTYEGHNGPFKRSVTCLWGRSLAKKITECNRGGGGIEQKSDVTPPKNIGSTVSLYLIHTLHSTILSTFDVAVYLDDTFCVENMHILAKMKPTICKSWLIFISKFVTFGGMTRGMGFKVKDN